MTGQPDAAPSHPWWRRVPWTLVILLLVAWGGSQWLHRRDQAAQVQAIQQANPEGRILMYTSATCIYCDRAKAWLDQARIPYKECRVDEPGPCAEAFTRMGAPGTPVVQVDADKFQLGFDPGWLAEALGSPPRR